MAISATNLTVRYGRTTIIDDMTFGPLDDGKITGLIGPNGAGKSTLVKTLAGINKPSEGSADIVVDGRTGGLVDPGDPAALADQVIRVLTDHDLRKQQEANAAAHIRDEFASEAWVKRLRHTYEAAIAAKRS